MEISRAKSILSLLYVICGDQLRTISETEVKEAIDMAQKGLSDMRTRELESQYPQGGDVITSSTNIDALPDDLVTVEWDTWDGETHTLALYKEEYRYSGGLALFMWDLTDNEPWGDVTVNLPGEPLDEGEIFLGEYVCDDTIDALQGIITPTGEEVQYNYGMFKVATYNKAIIDKLPSQKELMEILYS